MHAMSHRLHGSVLLSLVLPTVPVLAAGAVAAGQDVEDGVPIIFSTDLFDPIDWP